MVITLEAKFAYSSIAGGKLILSKSSSPTTSQGGAQLGDRQVSYRPGMNFTISFSRMNI
jgi:hypothetical protein